MELSRLFFFHTLWCRRRSASHVLNQSYAVTDFCRISNLCLNWFTIRIQAHGIIIVLFTHIHFVFLCSCKCWSQHFCKHRWWVNERTNERWTDVVLPKRESITSFQQYTTQTESKRMMTEFGARVCAHACTCRCGPQDMWPHLPLPCLVLQSPLGSVRGYLPVWWLNPELSPSVSHVRCMQHVYVCVCVCVQVFPALREVFYCIGGLDKHLSVGSSGGCSFNYKKMLMTVE